MAQRRRKSNFAANDSSDESDFRPTTTTTNNNNNNTSSSTDTTIGGSRTLRNRSNVKRYGDFDNDYTNEEEEEEEDNAMQIDDHGGDNDDDDGGEYQASGTKSSNSNRSRRTTRTRTSISSRTPNKGATSSNGNNNNTIKTPAQPSNVNSSSSAGHAHIESSNGDTLAIKAEDVSMEDETTTTQKKSKKEKGGKREKRRIRVTFNVQDPESGQHSSSTVYLSKKHLKKQMELSSQFTGLTAKDEKTDELEGRKTVKQQAKTPKKSTRGGPTINPALSPESQLPIKIGAIQVKSLGTIEYENPSFHTENYIFPVGYKSERVYPSYVHPEQKTIYTCEILKQNEAPVFRIVASDDISNELTSQTATGVWSLVIKKINSTRSKPLATVSGPEYFGLSNQKVQQLIELLPNADKCVSYQTKFNYTDQGLLNGASSATSSKRKRTRTQSKRGDEETNASENEDDSSRSLRSKKKSKTSNANVDEVEPEVKRKKKSGSKSRKAEESTDAKNKGKGRQAAVESSSESELESPNPLENTPYEGVLSIEDEPLPPLEPFELRWLSEKALVYPGHGNAEYWYWKENHYTYDQVLQAYQEYNKKYAHTLHSKQKQTAGQFLDKLMSDQRSKRSKEVSNVVRPTEPKEQLSDKETLNTMWEFAYLLYSFVLLRPVLKFMDFEPAELEDALINPHNHNALLTDLHVKLVKGPALDPKAISYLEPNCLYWKTILKNKLDVIEERYWLWKVNPMLDKTYEELPVSWRVIVLRSLLLWKFDHQSRVYDFCRKKYDGDRGRIAPIGKDSAGNTYWYFGEEIGRLYVETPPVMKSRDSSAESSSANQHHDPNMIIERTGSWNILCSNMQEFKDTAQYFASLPTEDDRELGEYITDSIIPNLEAYEFEREKLKQVKLEEDMMKKEKAAKRKAAQAAKQAQEEEEAENGEEEEMVQPEAFIEPIADSVQTPRKRGRPSRLASMAQTPSSASSTYSVGPSAADTPGRRALRPRKQRYAYTEEDEDKSKTKDDDGEFVAAVEEDDEDDYQVEEDDEADEEYVATPTTTRKTTPAPESTTKRTRGRPPKASPAPQTPQFTRAASSSVATTPNPAFTSPNMNTLGYNNVNLQTRDGVQLYINMYRQQQMMQLQQMQMQMLQQQQQSNPQTHQQLQMLLQQQQQQQLTPQQQQNSQSGAFSSILGLASPQSANSIVRPSPIMSPQPSSYSASQFGASQYATSAFQAQSPQPSSFSGSGLNSGFYGSQSAASPMSQNSATSFNYLQPQVQQVMQTMNQPSQPSSSPIHPLLAQIQQQTQQPMSSLMSQMPQQQQQHLNLQHQQRLIQQHQQLMSPQQQQQLMSPLQHPQPQQQQQHLLTQQQHLQQQQSGSSVAPTSDDSNLDFFLL